jgi:hypothetical protein
MGLVHKLVTLPMPEAGGERELGFYKHHNCRDAKAFRAALEDEDIDLLQWSVGIVGAEMPAWTPFEVVSTDICFVCHRGPFVLQFQWSAPKLWVPS